MENNWHAKTINAILKENHFNSNGLSNEEAGINISKYGYNELEETKPDSIWTIFLHQFKSPLIYILFFAAFIMILIKEAGEALIVFAILLFNAIVGTVQEGKAQNTFMALRKFSEAKAVVLRDGKEVILSDKEVTVGDIIILQEGEKVPADARVIFSNGLRLDEAILTGESVPVNKICEKIDLEIPLEERANIIFKGTNVVSGNGRAMVFAVGANTKIGLIAEKIRGLQTDSPLKVNIANLSRLILYIAGIVCLFLFIFGILLGKPLMDLFMISVSLTVSIIPEGLPIVVTLILAMGVWRMGKRNALIKKLQAVEALGQATIIAVDKTGTITKNELFVRKLYIDNKFYEITGNGYDPKGSIIYDGKNVNVSVHKELIEAKEAASLTTGARLLFSQELNKWEIRGDPTDGAMLVFAKKINSRGVSRKSDYSVLDELPFDYKVKYRATLYHKKGNEHNCLSVVGAPEIILSFCDRIMTEGKIIKLTAKKKEEVLNAFEQMSQEGLRVIAFAKQDDCKKDEVQNHDIKKCIFIGFFGMKDSVREESKGAIAKIEKAGIRTVMITGDYEITGRAIAKEAGIFKEGDETLTGADFDNLPPNEIAEKLKKVSVFARFNPEYKLKIIEAYKANGHVIAMTGDGVNDAPSLVAADLGISMGKTGTEVAKEASDIVLLDDNLNSIVCAVEEGRSIYNSIRKVTLYLFSTSLGEVFIIISALFLGFPLPVLAVQIIWINFVTDGFLDVALAMEPKEKGLLKRKNRKNGKYIIDRSMMGRVLMMAIVMTLGTLIMFNYYLNNSPEKAFAVVFTLLAVFQWYNAWNCRSENKSFFSEMGANKFLIISTVIVFVLQLFAVYNPLLQSIFKTVPLDVLDWFIIFFVGSSIVVVEEIRKYIIRGSSDNA